MSLPWPQPDHRRMWTVQQQLCLWGTKRAQRGPPSLETTDVHTQPGMGLSPPSPWQLPPLHLLSTMQEAQLTHN